MPLAILNGLDVLIITGARDEAVEGTKNAESNGKSQSHRSSLSRVSGEALAFQAGDYEGSVSLYIRAYEAMHFIVECARFEMMLDRYFTNKPMIGGRFHGQRGDFIRHHLGSHLSWNILQAHLKLER